MRPQNPVIVIPGITASELRDEYPVRPESVWSAILNHDFERICQHPEDLRYEAKEPARVRADAVFPLVYGDLVAELRHNLARKADEPVPVFPFAYDWRQPLRLVVQQLAGFVQEVVDRTKLLRHYATSDWFDEPKVDLVGHSMGGLLITGYLAEFGKKSQVGRVATLGTPFQGSYEAPIKVLTGTSSIGGGEQNSREREAARITPALYHLLPNFAGAVRDADGKEVDLYDIDAWQPGVLETLAEFVRLLAARPGSVADRKQQARALLQSMLDEARQYAERVRKFRLADAGLDVSRWLCVVGVGEKTRVALRQSRVGGKVRFELAGSDRRDDWEKGAYEDHGGKALETGDSTVPYRGAVPPFLGKEHLVCVRPSDFGYWEMRDRLLATAAGFHGALPALNLAQRLVVAHLRDAVAGDNHWARPSPELPREMAWQPPIRGLAKNLKW